MSAAHQLVDELPPCAHCSATHTPLTRDAESGDLVCLPGHGCGVGLSLREALGHDRKARCGRPLCPRPPTARGLCVECLAVDHASRIHGMRGGEAS